MIYDPNSRAQRVNQVYTDLNRKFEEQETQRKAKEQKIAYLNLYGFPVEAQTLQLLPKETAEAFHAIVFYREGKNITLVIVDSNPSVMQVLNQLTEQAYISQPFLISLSSFKHIFA